MNIPKLKIPKGITAYFNASKAFIAANNPSIMTGIAAGVTLIFGYSVAKAAITTHDICKEMEEEDTVEKIKKCAPCWIEPALELAIIETCILGANKENSKRLAAMAGAYSVSESTLKEYKEKTAEVIGKRKAEDISRQVVENKIANTPCDYIFETRGGDQLFFDASSGRYFKSDRAKIERAINKLNASMINNTETVCLNDLYFEIGLPPTNSGAYFCWDPYSQQYIEAVFTPVFMPDGITTCTEIDLSETWIFQM